MVRQARRSFFCSPRLGAAFLALLVIGLAPCLANAQRIVIEGDRRPLAQALSDVGTQANVDVVFAQRLVADLYTNCRYRGSDVASAFRCLLAGTRLEARSTGPAQYVLVRASAPKRRLGIFGTVMDRETTQPLPGANVLVIDRGLGAASNRTGFFAFPTMPEGPHRIRITFLGYATLDTFVVAGDRVHRFELKPRALESAGLLVESTEIRPGDQTPLPGMLTPPIARLERLPASLGGQDLLEALTWTPGIRRAGEVSGGLLIRGAGPDQNLYLLDGAPVYHPWHAFSLISTFQTETFRSVRVYRGAYPAEFGGRLSAVLDAELTDGSGLQPRVQAALNTHSARFLIEAPLSSRASFMFGGRRSYIDRIIGKSHPVSDDSGRRDTLRTGYFFYDWTAKLVFRPDDRSRLSIMSYRGRDDLDLRLPFDLSLDLSSWLRPTDLLFEVREFWRNRVVSTRYERLLSERWYLTATAHDSRYQAEESAFLQPSSSSSVQSSYNVDIRDTGLRIDLDYFHSARNRMRMGVLAVGRDFESDVDAVVNYNPSLTERLKEASNSRAVELTAYVQSTWLATERLEVRSGLRAAAFGSDRLARLEPRLSVQWSADPQLLVMRASFTRSYQYLHRIRDRHSVLYDLVSSRWIPASNSTPPVRGTEIALDVESRPQDWTLRASTYYREQVHVLLPRDAFQSKNELAGPGIEVGTLLGQYESGTARAGGVEAGGTYQKGAVLATLGLAIERSVTSGPSDGDRFIPARYDVPVTTRGYIERRGQTWSYGLGLLARSGYPITVPEARYAVAGPVDDEPTTYLFRPTAHNGRLPLYWRLDVNASRSFVLFAAQWRAQLQLYNALGHRNVIDRFFEPDGNSVHVTQRRGLPILPLFELRVDL